MYLRVIAVAVAVAFLCGCGNKEVEKALDSDANGSQCAKCGEKFYTDREVFASACPKCKSPELLQVVGYYCEKDKHMMLGPRGRGSYRCEKCGNPTTGRMVPKESDFKAWGAAKRPPADVGA
jgi:DNA-directed RNA polymerase subunit RPC12/RpoP